MKISRVIPLFKSGDHRHFQNNRPFSVLPIFSKLLERIVYNRIINYVDKFVIISDHQYGFRKNNSPSQALLQLYNKISAAIDRKEFTVGIFLDLSKAFDTVNHDIFLINLNTMVSEEWLLIGSKTIFIIDCNSFSIMTHYLPLNLFGLEYRKGLSLVHFFFYYISMIYVMLQMYLNLFFLLMTRIYFIPIKTNLP